MTVGEVWQTEERLATEHNAHPKDRAKHPLQHASSASLFFSFLFHFISFFAFFSFFFVLEKDKTEVKVNGPHFTWSGAGVHGSRGRTRTRRRSGG